MSKTIDQAPFAITSDGKVLANLVHVEGSLDMSAFTSRVLREGDAIFVGVVLRSKKGEEVCERMELALLDVLGRFFGEWFREREAAERQESAREGE